MATIRACPKCGYLLPSDATPGSCPICRRSEARTEPGPSRPIEIPTELKAPNSPDWTSTIQALEEMGILSAAELRSHTSMAGSDVHRLARELIRAGKLTAYQAKALVQGKSRGLRIGDYLVVDKLGAGGMGVVFKARHRPTGRVIALKILPPSFGREPDSVRRFRREFQVASGLNHPNIVRAIESSEDRGVYYLTMEYIPGYTLQELVTRGGPMSIKLALHCVIQAARGLEAAHALGVIHRDIKPGNIMIDPTGGVRVLDLGLARVIEATSPLGRKGGGSLTHTGAFMGTVDYLAPEQANDAKSADVRSDIYSLGCTLHFLLTGLVPFPADTMIKRLMAHMDLPAPSLRARLPEVSVALEGVYQRMMAKGPVDRPQSMSEVVLELEACRSSVREAGDASVDLKTFAQTALKRAPVKNRRGADASVFLKPTEGKGEMPFDPDLDLEDLVAGYRQEIARKPIPEEKLPPIAQLPIAPLPVRPRRFYLPHALMSMAALALLGVAIWPFSKSKRPGVETGSNIDQFMTISSKRPDMESMAGAFRIQLIDGRSRPTLLAPFRSTNPVADGEIQPGEYGPGVEVDFTADSAFGMLLQKMPDPSSSKTPEDLSVTLHAAYNEKSLFLGFRVRDQFVDAEKSEDGKTRFNDCVEVFLDGDRIPNDFLPADPGRKGNSEGFQLVVDAAGIQSTTSEDFSTGEWRAGTGRIDDGYVVEFEIPLAIIDVRDGPAKAPAGPGSLIHFGMAIVDNDTDVDRQMSYAYLRSTKDVGSPFFGLEEAWSLAIELLPSSLNLEASATRKPEPKLFSPLFPVDNLSGWLALQSKLGDWRLEDGVLFVVGHGDPGTTLRSRKSYSALTLRLEFEQSAEANGGVFLIGQAIPGAESLPFLEINIAGRASGEQTGTVYFNRDGNKLEHRNTRGLFDKDLDKPWNTLEIEKQEDRFSVTLNGKAISYEGKFPEIKGPWQIAFQAKQGTLQYRKIELKDLSEESLSEQASRNDSSASKPHTDDFVSLFNGRDLTGWEIASSPLQQWTVENGVLIAPGFVEYSVLRTTRGNYKDFHLRVETRLTDRREAAINIRYSKDEGGRTLTYFNSIAGGGGNTTKAGDFGRLRIQERTFLGVPDLPPMNPGDWVTVEIIAIGDTFTEIINGRQVLKVQDPDRAFSSGAIALYCSKQTQGAFRKIEIKELNRESIPAPVEIPPNRLVTIRYDEGRKFFDLDWGLEAAGLFNQALELQRKLMAEDPSREDYRTTANLCCNRLSTLYSTYLDPKTRNPSLALELSNEALLMKPDDAITWQNLGWARYRVGDWKGCVAAIEESMRLSNAPAGWDWFFLAMAYHQMGDTNRAAEYYRQAVTWLDAQPPGLQWVVKANRIKDEAAELLGLKSTP